MNGWRSKLTIWPAGDLTHDIAIIMWAPKLEGFLDTAHILHHVVSKRANDCTNEVGIR